MYLDNNQIPHTATIRSARSGLAVNRRRDAHQLSAIEDLSAKVEFRESEVDFFRQEAMEKDAEILHLKERIKRMKRGSEGESDSDEEALEVSLWRPGSPQRFRVESGKQFKR